MLDLTLATLFLGAFVAAGVAQLLWLRSPWYRSLAYPLDLGRRCRGRPIFGANKTQSGFAGMVLFVTLAFAAMGGLVAVCPGLLGGYSPLPPSPGAWAKLGILAGLGYMAAELPNSFVKRQLGIAPGDLPHGRLGRALAMVVDQVDSVVGAIAAVALVLPLSWTCIGLCIAGGPLLHWLFNLVMHRLGMKERAA